MGFQKNIKKKSKIQILSGPPGSGKTTYANYLLSIDSSYVRVNRDDLRKMLKDAYVLDDKLEIVLNKVQEQTISALLEKGYNIILDNTYCKIRYINQIINSFASIADVELVLIEPELSLEDLKQRNRSREKVVPEEVVESMYKSFQVVKNSYQEIYEYIQMRSNSPKSKIMQRDPSLPKAIIVDIDGTIAHMGDRRPYDWAKVGEDTPDESILNIVKILRENYQVIFLSGRDSVCRPQTEEWLNKYYGDDYELYMRKEKDSRKDSIIKRELYETHIKPLYNIVCVFDDRNQVVDMWRQELGLKCLQVEYGNF